MKRYKRTRSPTVSSVSVDKTLRKRDKELVASSTTKSNHYHYLDSLVDDNFELSKIGKQELSKCNSIDSISIFNKVIEEAISLKKFSNAMVIGDASKHNDIPLATDDGYQSLPLLEFDHTDPILKVPYDNIWTQKQSEINNKLESHVFAFHHSHVTLPEGPKMSSFFKQNEVYEPKFVDEKEVTEFDPITGFDQYFDRIESGEFADLITDGFRMPGNEFAYEGCGKYSLLKGCVSPLHIEDGGQSQDFVKKIKYTCDRISCTSMECMKKAIHKKSSRGSTRLECGIALLRSKLSHSPLQKIPQHVVFSLSKENYWMMNTKKGTLKLESQMRKQLKGAGLLGGIMVYHPWRFVKPDTDTTVSDFDPTLEIGDPYFSPHYHIVGYGWTKSYLTAINYAKTGNVIYGSRALLFKHDARVLLDYLLTHTGVKEGSNVIRYFGALSYNKFKTAQVLEHSLELTDDISKIFDTMNTTSPMHPSRNMPPSAPKKVKYLGPLFNDTPTTELELDSPIEEFINKYEDAIGITATMSTFEVSPVIHNKTGEVIGQGVKYASQKEVMIGSVMANSFKDFDTFRQNVIKFVVDHKDNPAFPTTTLDDSDPPAIIPSKILNLRFVYTETTTKNQVTKFNLTKIDPSTDNICPICYQKLRLVVPKDKSNPTLILDLPLDIGVCVDRGLYEDVDGYDVFGKQIWDEERLEKIMNQNKEIVFNNKLYNKSVSKILYPELRDTKIGIIPPYFDKYPQEVKAQVSEAIMRSAVVYELKVSTGDAPTKVEVDMEIANRNNTIDIYGRRTTKNTQSLESFT